MTPSSQPLDGARDASQTPPPATATGPRAEMQASGAHPTQRIVRLLWSLIVLLCLLLAARLWLLTPYRIPTASMEPTLRGDRPAQGIQGDTVLVAKLAYLLGTPGRWDLVAFRGVPGESGAEPPGLVKRIVGLPGERIRIENGDVLVDGEVVSRPAQLGSVRYLPRGRYGTREVELGPDEYFVLGDNSYLSQDSRHWGPLARQRIFGRVVAIIQPWSRFRWLGRDAGGNDRATGAPSGPREFPGE